jgi:dTMP kinase
VPRGKFITLEGGEGAGKSTQAALLAERLRATGIDVEVTREPGGTSGAEAIRELFVTGAVDRWSATTEALLINAARADHVARRIRPALDDGRWVICDRFIDSTLAYQGAGKGTDQAELRHLHSLATGDLWPDLTLILALPIADGLARAAQRPSGAARFEAHDRKFHQRVAHGFESIAATDPHRCKLIDARGDIDAVAPLLWEQVLPLTLTEAATEDDAPQSARDQTRC